MLKQLDEDEGYYFFSTCRKYEIISHTGTLSQLFVILLLDLKLFIQTY